jgi:pimeloyl-ACP methyl ester carboxylesterase
VAAWAVPKTPKIKRSLSWVVERRMQDLETRLSFTHYFCFYTCFGRERRDPEATDVLVMVQRLLRKKRLYFSIVLAALLLVGYRFAEFRRGDKIFQAVLAQNPYGYEAHIDYYLAKGRWMRYVEIGSDSLPLIVFIHGTPSSSAFWEGLMRDSVLLSQAKLLAVDRPGYGYSGFGRAEVSVERQAAKIAKLLLEKREKHVAIILHGSSYGGTVAARLAMDYPELVDGLLLQSASVMPGEEKTYWISYPTSYPPLSWLMPATIRVANAEKLSHREQLEAMEPLWDRVRSAAIILHGTKDGLIYPKNALFAKEKLINAAYLELEMVKDRGHDLLFTGRQLLVNSLLKLIHLNYRPSISDSENGWEKAKRRQ